MDFAGRGIRENPGQNCAKYGMRNVQGFCSRAVGPSARARCYREICDILSAFQLLLVSRPNNKYSIMLRVFTVLLVSLLPAIALADDCVPTVERSPGMHYKPVTEFKANTGKGLRFSGHVRAAGDCKAIAGAKVGHWQANGKGLYDDDHRGYVLSNQNGSYSFDTDWPAASEGRPPHVFFIVIAKGYKTLITRWDSENTKPAQVNLVLVPAPAAPPAPAGNASQ
jgi:hypothetical protein